MDEEQLKTYLSENLYINASVKRGYYGSSSTLVISLQLDDKVISTDYIDLGELKD